MFGALNPAARREQERERTISASLLDSMESQLIAVYAEKELLQKEIGVSDARDVITRIRTLEDLLAGFTQPSQDNEPHETEEIIPSHGGDGLRDLSHRVRVLTGTVTSMEAQLIDVYADREMLYREGGIKEAQDVIARVRENERLREQTRVMETQLAALYSQKHTLSENLGTGDAREVVSLVRTLAEGIEVAHQAARKLLPASGGAMKSARRIAAGRLASRRVSGTNGRGNLLASSGGENVVPAGDGTTGTNETS